MPASKKKETAGELSRQCPVEEHVETIQTKTAFAETEKVGDSYFIDIYWFATGNHDSIEFKTRKALDAYVEKLKADKPVHGQSGGHPSD